MNKKRLSVTVRRSPIVSEDRFRRVAPKFLGPELGALFLVSKTGKVRVEERERDRGETSRLLVSAANLSTMLFLAYYRERTSLLTVNGEPCFRAFTGPVLSVQRRAEDLSKACFEETLFEHSAERSRAGHTDDQVSGSREVLRDAVFFLSSFCKVLARISIHETGKQMQVDKKRFPLSVRRSPIVSEDPSGALRPVSFRS